jgi:hypothetical protein
LNPPGYGDHKYVGVFYLMLHYYQSDSGDCNGYIEHIRWTYKSGQTSRGDESQAGDNNDPEVQLPNHEGAV